MGVRYGIESAIFVALYLVFLLMVGLRLFRKVKTDADEYLVMGRKLSLPAFVASIVSTWYGGILGVGVYSFKYGLSNWLVFGLPYYLSAFLFAMFLAKRAQVSRHYTIPDQLNLAYGKSVSIVGASFVFLTAVPSAYILQVGILAENVFGIPLVIGVVAGAFFSIFYIFSGGLRGDIITDIAQFALMFLGFIVMLVFLATHYGGLDFLQAHVPAVNFTWKGTKSASYIFVWYFIALATLVEPSFYQRCFAAKTPSTARRGILLAIPFWALFDFLTTSTGLYARALMPDLADPVSSYPALGALVLPGALQGLFLVGMFATVMSTVDTYSFVAGTTLGRDIILRLKKGALNNGANITLYSRLGLVASAGLAIAIALYFKSVIDIWYVFGTIGTCALMVPLASSFSDRLRMRPKMAMASIICSTVVVLIWLVPNIILGKSFFFGLDPIYPGLATSLGMWGWDRLTRSK